MGPASPDVSALQRHHGPPVDSARHTCCNDRRLPRTKFSPADADPAQEGKKVIKVSWELSGT